MVQQYSSNGGHRQSRHLSRHELGGTSTCTCAICTCSGTSIGATSAAMDSLTADVRAILRMRERGGRIRHEDTNEIVVLDVPEFTEGVSSALLLRHPTLHISIEACPESLSGFAVRMRLHSDASRHFVTAVACVAVLVAICAHCMV